MIAFAAGLVMLLIAVAAFVAARRDPDERTTFMVVSIAAPLIGVALIGLSCVTVVDARAVGIQTNLGRYRSTLPSGWSVTAPWSSVEQWTTRNQTVRFAGDGRGTEHDNFKTEPRVVVRLGNQSEAYVEATVTWRITEGSVEGLWKQHKTFDDARRDFITPTAQSAVNTTFDGYDPFRVLNTKAADNPYVPLDEWSRRVVGTLRPALGARSVELLNVQVTRVSYDQRTEDKLRAFADEVANTRIADQKIETARREAEASNARRATAGTDCISLLRDLAAADQLKNLPPGTNVCGGAGTPVIVGGGAR